MKKENKQPRAKISRRAFLGTTGLGAAAFMIVPRHVLGGSGFVAPSDKLNIACVGVGGKGRSDMFNVSSENIVAFCDVDDRQVVGTMKQAKELPDYYEQLEKASKYKDFRVMLEKEKSIDAITVSTPDHNHAIIAMTAILLGKHVYVQKPLTQTVEEARLLKKVAKEAGVVTQMGNQGHADEGARLINEWIWDGAIGDVREVHVWTNRPIWPQGIPRPTGKHAIPPELDWNLWLGTADFRPYNPGYAPFSWRGYWAFGTGALGDMGAHLMDHPYWALKLGLPTRIQASSTPFTYDSYPIASTVYFEFPARGDMPAVKLTWYDGGMQPPRPEALEQNRRLGADGGGVLFMGDKGLLACGTYGRNPRIVPETRMQEYKRPPKSIPRSPGIYAEWIEAIKNGTKATSGFDYSAALTETMLLGNIAIRLADEPIILEYDAGAMRFTNAEAANQYLRKDYRPGWELPVSNLAAKMSEGTLESKD